MAKTTAQAVDPLGSLTRLGPSVYLRDPSLSTSSANNSVRGRRTIILCTWMGATSRNIATYVAGYVRLDPTARIILIRNSIPNMVYRAASVQQRDLRPVVEAICAEPDRPLLVHLFSNAGAQQTCVLAAAYRAATGRLLPVQAMIFDSTPGQVTFSNIKAVMAYELPREWYWRLPGLAAVYVLLFVYWMVARIIGRLDIVSRSRNDLNDVRLIEKDAERCYIYAEADELVSWQDVEEHCDDAEARGWRTTREKFEGSAHVRHVKVDPERYWNIPRRLLTVGS
ncbi:hypothetical protein MMC24_001712 [Lignoscripta atroalba]|nr:hypothetical protein [Lignoscripta atroalba]